MPSSHHQGTTKNKKGNSFIILLICGWLKILKTKNSKISFIFIASIYYFQEIILCLIGTAKTCYLYSELYMSSVKFKQISNMRFSFYLQRIIC